MEPSSSDLKYFLEVARLGSISRASEKIGISQPSLSLAIQRVEDSLGEKLLVREKRGTKLTKAGESLLANSLLMIEVWNKIKSEVKSVNESISGEFIVGCHPEVAIDSLPLFLPNLLEKYPELNINLKHGHSREITSDVIDMKVDVGIVVNPEQHLDLVIKYLSNDQVSFWVGQGKKPMQQPSTGESVLICDTNMLQSQALIKKYKKAGFKYRHIISTADLEVALSLVESGCGIGILPSEVALRHPQYKLKRIEGSPSVNDKVAIIYRRENRVVSAIQKIVDAIVVGHQQKYGTL